MGGLSYVDAGPWDIRCKNEAFFTPIIIFATNGVKNRVIFHRFSMAFYFHNLCVSVRQQDQVRFARKKAGRRVLSHINRFSGTEWCFRWVLFWENVLGGTKWNVA